MKLFIMQSPPLLYYLLPLRAKYLPQHRILEHPQSMFLPRCERPSITHSYVITGKITVLYISFLIYLDYKLEDRRFWTGWYQTFPEFTCALTFFMNAILNCEGCFQIFKLFHHIQRVCFLSFCFDSVAHSVCVLLYSIYAFTQEINRVVKNQKLICTTKFQLPPPLPAGLLALYCRLHFNTF